MRLQDVKVALRAGKYTSLGCYPLYFVMVDGCVLCFKCARENWRLIVRAHLSRETDWYITGVTVNWEDSVLFCDQCGEQIESAYGEDGEESQV